MVVNIIKIQTNPGKKKKIFNGTEGPLTFLIAQTSSSV